MNYYRRRMIAIVIVAAGIVLLAVVSYADILNFSCTGDPLATGFRIKSTTNFAAPAWAVLAEAPTCAFAVQRPAVRTLYQLCAFNAGGETCRENNGYFSYPVPPTLTIGPTSLQ